MKTFLIFLISLYQRWLSPHKGFRCAHAAQHGGLSCSWAIKAIIADHGLINGWPLIRRRFEECQEACRVIQEEEHDDRKKKRKRRRHGGEQDCCGDFVPDDAGLCCAADTACDVLDCLPDFYSHWR